RRLLDAAGDVVDRLSGPLRIEELLPHAFGQKHDRIDAASHLVQRFLQVEDRRPYILGIVCHGSLPMTASGSSLAPGAENRYGTCGLLPLAGIVSDHSRQRARFRARIPGIRMPPSDGGGNRTIGVSSTTERLSL